MRALGSRTWEKSRIHVDTSRFARAANPGACRCKDTLLSY